MIVNGRNFNFIKNSGFYEIPYFQRKYVWNEENWEQLLENFSADMGNHFLGSIILSKINVASGEKNRFSVIDGQQRLTTISILLKAIYDSLPPEKQEDIKDEVIGCLFQKNDKDLYETKIRHSRFDKDYFEYVMGVAKKEIIGGHKIDVISSPIITAPSKNRKKHQIVKCYSYFYQYLSQKTEKEILDFYNLICPDSSVQTDNSPKMLVVIDLDPIIDNEQLIFDTINSTGVRLTATDIIKNKLFQRLRSFNDVSDDEVNQFYENHWEKVFENNEDIEYWSKYKKTGRFSRQVSEILLHSVALIKQFYDPEKQQLTDLPTVYKTYIDKKLTNSAELKKFIEEIEEYANIYKRNMLLTPDTIFHFSDTRKRLLHILDKSDLSTLQPYVLFLVKKYDSDKIALEEKLKNLENFVVRGLLAHRSNKNYNKDCKQFIQEENLVLTKANEISNEEILAGIQKMNNKDASIILFWLELSRIKNEENDISKLQDCYTLEHIMPQSWRENWSDVPVKDDNDIIIQDAAAADIRRTRLIFSIGNMTLVTSKFNISLRNYNFKRKIEGDGDKHGYMDRSALTITTKDIIEDVYEKNKDNPIWDEYQIYLREQKLGKEIINIWGQKSGANVLEEKRKSNYTPNENDILYMQSQKGNYNAKGFVLENEHFVLQKGSKLAETASKNCPATHLKNREIYKKIINADYITTEDIVFESLSSAAGFVCYYSINGLNAWKNKEGKKYCDI